MTHRPCLVVVGATGAVGDVLLRTLSTREDVWGEIRPVASAGSAGRVLRVRGEELPVLPPSYGVLDGADVVLLVAPAEVALRWAPEAVARGAVVVDGSGAFRDDPRVPLVVPEVNPSKVRDRPLGVVASPGATTLTVVEALGALHRVWGLRQLVLSTYQAASELGRSGVRRLYDELAVVTAAGSPGQTAGDVRRTLADRLGAEGSPFPAPLALNVVPWVGGRREDGGTGEEAAVRSECRRVLGLPELRVSVTCVRVPVVTTHSVAVHAVFEGPVRLDDARRALVEAPNVVLVEDDGSGDEVEFPTPVDVVGAEPTFAGRLRVSADVPQALDLFVCGDNLRKGAALNLVQIGELLAAELAPA